MVKLYLYYNNPISMGGENTKSDTSIKCPWEAQNEIHCTKAAACANTQETKVESMGAPGKPQIRTGSKSVACAHQTGIRKKATGAPGKPKVR